MENLSRMHLFSGIDLRQLPALLACIQARHARYGKDELMIAEGDPVHEFGILLSGRARSIKWDAEGKIFLLTLIEQGGEIGILLAASSERRSPVSVQALGDVHALFIPHERVLARCEKACAAHDRLLRNYVAAVAEKGLMLHERIDCLLKPSLRAKIHTYLQRVSRERHSRAFTIPLDRNAMAEYLNIERSSLSRELSHMKRDGLIDYHKNSFKLL